MYSSRLAIRCLRSSRAKSSSSSSSASITLRSSRAATRPFTSTSVALQNQKKNQNDNNDDAVSSTDRVHSTAPAHREYQTSRPLNPQVPNTTSTMTKDFPKVGEYPAPPELLSSVDPNYQPAEPYEGKLEHFTGGTQHRGAQKPELGVGEMEGITFKVEPLKRKGEDTATMRARLLCTSRKKHANARTPMSRSTFEQIHAYTKGTFADHCFVGNRPKSKERNSRIRSPPLHLRRRLPRENDPRTTPRV